MITSRTRVVDPRRLIASPVRCAGCLGPTRLAEHMVGVDVGWCDFCWWRLIVRPTKSGNPPNWYRVKTEAI